MVIQTNTKTHKEAWREAERKSNISRYRTSGWGLEQPSVPTSENFRRSDFIKALKKAAHRKEQSEPSSE